jgi:hypothetical protein
MDLVVTNPMQRTGYLSLELVKKIANMFCKHAGNDEIFLSSKITICMGKDTFEEISSTEWYFRGEFGNFEELLEIPCNGKVPLRYQDLIGMCCPLHELTLYRHCNEFN